MGAICFDTDFPPLMGQAGAAHADIVLSPAGDWAAIDPRHTEIASFRAIEQGFNLLRQTHNGLSAAYDYQGHQLAQMDEFHARQQLTPVAQLPTRGTHTLYARIGDWLAWLSIAALAALLLQPLRKRSAQRHSSPPANPSRDACRMWARHRSRQINRRDLIGRPTDVVFIGLTDRRFDR